MKKIDLKALNRVLVKSILSITENPMQLKDADAKIKISEELQKLDEAYNEEVGIDPEGNIDINSIPEHLIIKDK